MAYITIKRSVSLDGPVLPESMAAPLYVAENMAHQFVITATSGGAPVTLTGTVQGRMIRPDGNTVLLTGSISNGNAVVSLPQSAYAYPGRFVLVIMNVASSVVTVLYSATGSIARTTTGATIDPGGVVPDITQLLAAIDEMVAATAAANEAASHAVQYDAAQSLTDAQKGRARENIGAADIAKALQKYGVRLTDNVLAIDDFDDAEPNTVYTLDLINAALVAHQPPGTDGHGTLLTFNGDTRFPGGQVQIYVSRYGRLYTRMLWGPAPGTWSDWEALGDTALQKYGTRITDNLLGIDDLDDAAPNRVYTINSTLVDHVPAGTNGDGTLLTFNGDTRFPAGQAQVFIGRYGRLYTRMLWGPAPGTWSDWEALGDTALQKYGTRITDNLLGIDDLDDAAPNRVYTINSTLVDHVPTGTNGDGTLLTFNGDTRFPAGQGQIFVSRYGRLYIRMLWGAAPGTWSEWREMQSTAEVLNLESEYSGVEMFERFGVIGDSFASGAIYQSGGYPDHIPLSWPQILARMSGNTAVNYSKGGLTTKTWLANTDVGMSKVLSDISGGNPCGLYLLCLGINDSNNTLTPGGLTYLGTVADIKSDYTQNADSFYGNYGRIIQQIQAASPSSRIVMCNFKRIPTTATEDGYEPFRAAIAEIAGHFSLPFIRLDDDAFFNSSFYMNNMVAAHPTAPQYVGYAKGINRLLSRAMIANYDYFKGYVGM